MRRLKALGRVIAEWVLNAIPAIILVYILLKLFSK